MNRMFVVAAFAATVISAGASAAETQDGQQIAALSSGTAKVEYLSKDGAAKSLKDQGYALVVGMHYWNHAWEGRALKAGQGWTKVRVNPIDGTRLSNNAFARVASLY